MSKFEEIKRRFKRDCIYKAYVYTDRNMVRFGLDILLGYYRQYLAGVFMFTEDFTPEEYRDEVAEAGDFVKKVLRLWESDPAELDAMLESLGEK